MSNTTIPALIGNTSTPLFLSDAVQLLATNYFGFASYTILVWDHFITFGDEVKYIWFGGSKKTFIICLFFINRYVVPFGFIMNLHAYLWPGWTTELCHHFVRFEGALTNIGLGVSALMMMIRVVAIYGGSRIIMGFLLFFFFIEVGINAWLMTAGIAVPHPQGLHGCSMIFSAAVGPWAAASAWMPLLYDTIVLVLTLYKTLKVAKRVSGDVSGGSSIASLLVRDGLLYYSMIFIANFVLIIMISTAPDGLKNIFAQFELLITVTMMSRITLSLRKNAREDDDDWIHDNYKTGFSAPLNPPTGTQSVAHWTFGMGGPNEDQGRGDDAVLDDDDSISLADFDGARARRQSVVRREQAIRIDMNPAPPAKDFTRIRWDGKAN